MGGMELCLVALMLTFVLGAWAIFAGVTALLGYTFYFPFEFAQSLESIPFHRWQVVRGSVFLTFGYLSLRHFLLGNEKLYPIQFIDIYLKFLVGTGIFIYYQEGINEYREYATLGFFFIASIFVHFLAKPDFKKIFFKR